jgi:hypothetical protein
LFCVGDHISWHCPIDSADTKLHHFLLAEDPQLRIVRTPYGSVQFLQLVGITHDELGAVQQWNGPEILHILRGTLGYVLETGTQQIRKSTRSHREIREGNDEQSNAYKIKMTRICSAYGFVMDYGREGEIYMTDYVDVLVTMNGS